MNDIFKIAYSSTAVDKRPLTDFRVSASVPCMDFYTPNAFADGYDQKKLFQRNELENPSDEFVKFEEKDIMFGDEKGNCVFHDMSHRYMDEERYEKLDGSEDLGITFESIQFDN